ncbi:gluconate 2-dehydrogenase subunit 3 family protein [Bowmanella yangjiangensis]|uniref:Gluconate 2-dehydrogenase subunit 3 family protein n=1 Tax=Bowmanella yangjiangensis TaxID=2811230 RepID=A0ABS3CRH7_9ALTE|nr:gluconate 2-dehydrogenase subunit 3 family protein [Bowmanella yangjiangensis]MBN7819255.1 gluconate 2-dehydrogenase subunit 3 family protein [Bowmanella yangjiangensis]
MSENITPYQYLPNMSRRESLKWLTVLAASAVVTSVSGCSFISETEPVKVGHWPDLTPTPIEVAGYGTDPNLILPPESPWPRTLSSTQLTLVAVLSDIIVPRDGAVPSATEVKVPDVIDEWVSAPYQTQQRDRLVVLNALAWIEEESQRRFNLGFVGLSGEQQLKIMDDIAYNNAQTPEEFKRIAKAFDRFRGLVLAAFYTSPEGSKDIGYLGNVPIAGDYPGPTEEARQHLEQVLASLKLSDYAYS